MESRNTFGRRNKKNHRNRVNYNTDWCLDIEKDDAITRDQPLNHKGLKIDRPIEMHTALEIFTSSISLFVSSF